MKLLISALAALALSVMPALGGGFEAGVAASKRGDYETALREFRPLAEQGDACAQYNLGLVYELGYGVPVDGIEANKWYRLAAQQDDAASQYRLGVLYDYGNGVPLDDVEAVSWYRSAAEQGHARAQYFLGYRYFEGEGARQDYVRAHMWFSIAAESRDGSINAIADALIIKVANLMTPEQIFDAQIMARNWIATHRDTKNLVCLTGFRPKRSSGGMLVAFATIIGMWLLFSISIGVPLARIFHRAGFTARWGLLALLTPVPALVVSWFLLAIRDWPMRRKE